MRNNVLLALIVFSFACGSSKQSAEVTETESVVETVVNDSTPATVAPIIAQAIIQGNDTILEPFYPTPQIAKFLTGAKGAAMTDEQIRSEMLDPLRERFQSNIQNMQDDMKKLNISASDLSYDSFEYFDTEEPATVPRALNIYIDNKGKQVKVPVTVLNIHEKWYVFEILLSTGRFD